MLRFWRLGSRSWEPTSGRRFTLGSSGYDRENPRSRWRHTSSGSRTLEYGPMTLTTGVRLGTYEILGPLGAGGMGEVYRAKDLRLGREIAIKVLPAELASNHDRIARFEREARTVAGLNHPNIVTLFSVEDEDDLRFLTMELVEGETLSTFVSPGGLPLPKLFGLAIPLT